MGGNFLFRISEYTQRERKCSFRKLQIFISQSTDFHFANYRFPFRKLQILISQTTDFHFANYRFPFRKLQISISQTTDFHFANYRFPFRFVPFRFANYSKPDFLCSISVASPCKQIQRSTESHILFSGRFARFYDIMPFKFPTIFYLFFIMYLKKIDAPVRMSRYGTIAAIANFLEPTVRYSITI